MQRNQCGYFKFFVTFLSVTLLLVLKPSFTDGMFFFRFAKFLSTIVCDSIDKTGMNLHASVFVYFVESLSLLENLFRLRIVFILFCLFYIRSRVFISCYFDCLRSFSVFEKKQLNQIQSNPY